MSRFGTGPLGARASAAVAAFPAERWLQAVRRFRGEFAWVAAGQAVALVGSVLVTKVVSNQLGASEYGRLALAYTIATALNQFLYGPLSVAAMRFYAPSAEKGTLGRFVATVGQILMVMTTLVLAGAAITAVSLKYIDQPVDRTLMLLAVLVGIGQNVLGLLGSMLAAARRRIAAAIFQAGDPLMRLALSASALAIFGPRATVAAVAAAAAMFAVAAVEAKAFTSALPREERNRTPSSAIALQLWGYGRYYIAFGFFTWLQLASDRWALKVFAGDATVGVYALCYSLASIPSVIVPAAFAQFVIPIVFARAGDATDRARLSTAFSAIRVSAIALSIWTVCAAVVTAAIGGPLVVLASSPAYRAGAPYLPVVVLGLGLGAIANLLALVPTSFNRMDGYLVIRIVHSLLAAALNAAGAYTMGLKGVCLAGVGSGAVLLVMLAFNIRSIRTAVASAPVNSTVGSIR